MIFINLVKVQGNFKVYTKSRFQILYSRRRLSFHQGEDGRWPKKEKEDFTRQYGNLTENIYNCLLKQAII